MIALMYHDVAERGREDASGFPGPDAARYKLTPAEFRAHARAIKEALRDVRVTTVETLPGMGGPGVLLTFDDGDASAHAPIADVLEEHGWRGHFFVTTDHVGTPAFLTARQVRDLRGRGHVIGSHSASHPGQMSWCGA